MGDQMIIYKALNKINGKIYVGQTVKKLSQRIYQHLYSKNGAFPKALRKYGKDNFMIECVENCLSKEELDDREKYWINYYRSNNRENGYNLTNGGDGNHGLVHTNETKIKIGLSNKGKNKGKKHPYLAEWNKNHSGVNALNYGTHQSEEQRHKRSLSMIGKNIGKVGPKGTHWSEEARKKFSEKLKLSGGCWYGKKRPEHSLLMLGEKNPSRREEVNKKRSETIKEWWQKRKENILCAA